MVAAGMFAAGALGCGERARVDDVNSASAQESRAPGEQQTRFAWDAIREARTRRGAVVDLVAVTGAGAVIERAEVQYREDRVLIALVGRATVDPGLQAVARCVSVRLTAPPDGRPIVDRVSHRGQRADDPYRRIAKTFDLPRAEHCRRVRSRALE